MPHLSTTIPDGGKAGKAQNNNKQRFSPGLEHSEHEQCTKIPGNADILISIFQSNSIGFDPVIP